MKKSKRTKAILAVFLCAVVVFSAMFLYSFKKTKRNFDVQSLPEDFTITGHTGCMGEKDNSIEAMEAAVSAGAQIIEFDLNFNEKGEPVLSHDEPKGDEVTLEKAFEFLQKHPAVLANVDAKSTKNLSAVQKLGEEYMVLGQLFYTGISKENTKAVQKGSPRIPYYLNVDVDKSKASNKDYLEEIAMKVILSGAVGINMHKRAVTKELCGFFHQKGLLVSVYTVNNEYELYRVLSCGPDNITSRRPDRLSKILETKNKVN